MSIKSQNLERGGFVFPDSSVVSCAQVPKSAFYHPACTPLLSVSPFSSLALLQYHALVKPMEMAKSATLPMAPHHSLLTKTTATNTIQAYSR